MRIQKKQFIGKSHPMYILQVVVAYILLYFTDKENGINTRGPAPEV